MAKGITVPPVCVNNPVPMIFDGDYPFPGEDVILGALHSFEDKGTRPRDASEQENTIIIWAMQDIPPDDQVAFDQAFDQLVLANAVLGYIE